MSTSGDSAPPNLLKTFVLVSDTHGFHNSGKLNIPYGDVLIFAGDAGVDDGSDMDNFNKWLNSLPHQHKIVVWGNMDSYAAKLQKKNVDSQPLQGATVLNDTFLQIGDYRILGSPWTPAYYGEWQHATESEAEAHWASMIKPDSQIDVLVTHGPPYGFGDLTKGRHAGDKQLMKAVQSMVHPPLLWVCGHIHESHGVHTVPHTNSGKNITLINAAADYIRRGVPDCQVRTVTLPFV